MEAVLEPRECDKVEDAQNEEDSEVATPEPSPRDVAVSSSASRAARPVPLEPRGQTSDPDVQVFRGEWDEEGVFVYQAFNEQIANWALQHQGFGGPHFNPVRMTWVKPSFAWVLYRSGYSFKHNQTRILKVKLSHGALAELLGHCQCRTGGGGSKGRVQWDPERDLMSGDGKAPTEMLRYRAIQIGLKGSLSELYVRSVLSIQDVTELARKVHAAHVAKDSKQAMALLLPELPLERPYLPQCPEDVLIRLRMMPGGGPLHQKRRGKH